MDDKFVQYIFEQAKVAGFTDIQLYYTADRDIIIHTHNGQITSNAASVSFEGRINERNVSAYTESFTTSDADFLIKTCAENAAFLEAMPARPLYAGSGEKEVYESFDSACADVAKIKENATEFSTVLSRYDKAFKDSWVNLKSQIRTVRVINDRGLDTTYTTSRIHAHCGLIYSRDGLVSNSQFYIDGNTLAQIRFESALRENIDHMNAYVSGIRPKSGKYRAVFSGECYSYLLMVTALFFAKDYVDSGNTRFCGKLGERVASDCVTIIDDPLMDGGFFSVPFDAQGVPTRTRKLITDGILTSLCCDLSTADESQNLEPGCFTRSRINTMPAISVTNMFIEPRENTRDELLEKLGNGLFITEVSDYFHRHGSDPITGDFSMPARGYFVKDGRLTDGAVDFSVSGNLYEILGKVEAVGDTLGYGLPSCLIPGMPMRIGGHASPDLLVSDVIIEGASE